MPALNLSNYFCSDEAIQFTYFRILCQLITHPWFKYLSMDSKLLYGMPLDRMRLFSKNQIPEDAIYPGMSLYELQGRDGQFIDAVLTPVPIPVLTDGPRDLKPGELVMDTGAGYYTPSEFEEKYLSPDYDDGARAERYGKAD